MGRMASVRRKFREAFFFFDRLSSHDPSRTELAEDVHFYLSAFLSAGRTIVEFVEKQQRWYPGWFHDWKMQLSHMDRKLLNDMTRQRDLEVHEEGADVIPDFNRDGLLASQRPQYYFWIDGKQTDVRSTCQRYLELLVKLLTDFEAHLSEQNEQSLEELSR